MSVRRLLTILWKGRAASSISAPNAEGLVATASSPIHSSSPSRRSHPYSVTSDSNPPTVASKDESRQMMALFPDLVRELTFEGRHTDSLPMLNRRLSRVLSYNVPHGKKNRGMTVPVTFKMLVPEAQHTEDNLKLANVLAWCVEMLQAFFLVADDIMDGSETRRGQACWYRVPDIGLDAFNDALFIESSIYTLLANHFKDKSYYTELLHAFIATTRHTILGQSLDLSSSLQKSDIYVDMYNMKRYAAIVKHKTSYYSFYFPVQLGMCMAGIKDPELYRVARNILLEMGHFFQVQDDYLDCFGDPAVTGKVGTDIQDGKCSWLICMAMQRANSEQKAQLKECYGIDDPEKVEKVKKIYNNLKLSDVYKKYEEASYTEITDMIAKVGMQQKKLPGELFTLYLNRIYKRDV